MTLDEAEQQAHEMLEALRLEYEQRAAPYIKIISDIRAIRPQVFYVRDDGGKLAEMIPLTTSAHRHEPAPRTTEDDDNGRRKENV